MEEPLTGTRVLDLSRLLPGPYCTQLLADLGADVIKIEEPGKGDYMRELIPGVYEAVNRNKRSVTLNLKSEKGCDTFYRIAKNADILVGQGEAPFTNRSIEKYYVEVPSESTAIASCDPANIRSLASAGRVLLLQRAGCRLLHLPKQGVHPGRRGAVQGSLHQRDGDESSGPGAATDRRRAFSSVCSGAWRCCSSSWSGCCTPPAST